MITGIVLIFFIVRVILFGIIWLLTLGRHQFWLFPNLLEDVGFFDSFKPVYKYEYKPQTNAVETNTSTKVSKEEKPLLEKTSDTKDQQETESEHLSGSDRQSDEDRPSGEEGAAKDQENGFEVIEKDDIDETETGTENEP